MKIILDDLSGAEIAAFLKQHIEDMKSVSPPESKHALDLDGLKDPSVIFWSAYEHSELVGCGALKKLDQFHAEIKSMRTAASARGKGVGSKLLQHILDHAKLSGYRKLSLETGSMDFFEPARRLYLKHGFCFCEPFGDYKKDPYSQFMQRIL